MKLDYQSCFSRQSGFLKTISRSILGIEQDMTVILSSRACADNDLGFCVLTLLSHTVAFNETFLVAQNSFAPMEVAHFFGSFSTIRQLNVLPMFGHIV